MSGVRVLLWARDQGRMRGRVLVGLPDTRSHLFPAWGPEMKCGIRGCDWDAVTQTSFAIRAAPHTRPILVQSFYLEQMEVKVALCNAHAEPVMAAVLISSAEHILKDAADG